MEYLSMWLFAIGLGDLIADLSGRPRHGTRARLAVLGASLAVLALSILAGVTIPVVIFLVAWTFLTSAGWIWARLPIEWSADRLAWTVALLLVATLGFTIGSLLLPVPDGAVLVRAIEAIGIGGLDHADLDVVLMGAAGIMVLQASGNAIVRLFLALAGTPAAAESELRGGRVIGPLERSLIFVLVLAGALTGAAIVAGAKGLLRFPELNREGGRIHVVTEYLLVGSLSSWFLALSVALLVRAAS